MTAKKSCLSVVLLIMQKQHETVTHTVHTELRTEILVSFRQLNSCVALQICFRLFTFSG